MHTHTHTHTKTHTHRYNLPMQLLHLKLFVLDHSTESLHLILCCLSGGRGHVSRRYNARFV